MHNPANEYRILWDFVRPDFHRNQRGNLSKSNDSNDEIKLGGGPLLGGSSQLVSPLTGVVPLTNGLNGLGVTNHLLNGMILQVPAINGFINPISSYK